VPVPKFKFLAYNKTSSETYETTSSWEAWKLFEWASSQQGQGFTRESQGGQIVSQIDFWTLKWSDISFENRTSGGSTILKVCTIGSGSNLNRSSGNNDNKNNKDNSGNTTSSSGFPGITGSSGTNNTIIPASNFQVTVCASISSTPTNSSEGSLTPVSLKWSFDVQNYPFKGGNQSSLHLKTLLRTLQANLNSNSNTLTLSSSQGRSSVAVWNQTITVSGSGCQGVGSVNASILQVNSSEDISDILSDGVPSLLTTDLSDTNPINVIYFSFKTVPTSSNSSCLPSRIVWDPTFGMNSAEQTSDTSSGALTSPSFLLGLLFAAFVRLALF